MKKGKKLPKFSLGISVYTAGVQFDLFGSSSTRGEHLLLFITECLNRHQFGDWGDVSPADQESNDRAVGQVVGQRVRIVSAYNLPERLAEATGEDKIWIITEADRSATTVLYPSEY